MDHEKYEGLAPERRLPKFWLLLALLALLVVVWSALRPNEPKETATPLEALSVRPLTFSGEEVTLDDVKGQVVVLNFWGTWCPPCREELPHIAALANHYKADTRCRVLAVSCGGAGNDPAASMAELKAETSEFLEAKGLELTVYADPYRRTRLAVKNAVGFDGYPTTLVLDPSGRIRRVWTGYDPSVVEEIARTVDGLLPGATPR
ncbi:MAG: TlpA family protein disulfide reductase [Pirellulales bacterium]